MFGTCVHENSSTRSYFIAMFLEAAAMRVKVQHPHYSLTSIYRFQTRSASLVHCLATEHNDGLERSVGCQKDNENLWMRTFWWGTCPKLFLTVNLKLMYRMK